MRSSTTAMQNTLHSACRLLLALVLIGCMGSGGLMYSLDQTTHLPHDDDLTGVWRHEFEAGSEQLERWGLEPFVAEIQLAADGRARVLSIPREIRYEGEAASRPRLWDVDGVWRCAERGGYMRLLIFPNRTWDDPIDDTAPELAFDLYHHRPPYQFGAHDQESAEDPDEWTVVVYDRVGDPPREAHKHRAAELGKWAEDKPRRGQMNGVWVLDTASAPFSRWESEPLDSRLELRKYRNATLTAYPSHNLPANVLPVGVDPTGPCVPVDLECRWSLEEVDDYWVVRLDVDPEKNGLPPQPGPRRVLFEIAGEKPPHRLTRLDATAPGGDDSAPYPRLVLQRAPTPGVPVKAPAEEGK